MLTNKENLKSGNCRNESVKLFGHNASLRSKLPKRSLANQRTSESNHSIRTWETNRSNRAPSGAQRPGCRGGSRYVEGCRGFPYLNIINNSFHVHFYFPCLILLIIRFPIYLYFYVCFCYVYSLFIFFAKKSVQGFQAMSIFFRSRN